MNCTQARFLLYAHLDRDVSHREAEELSRHLSQCAPCEARSRSAHGMASLLRSRLDRATAPPGLVVRLRRGEAEVRPRFPGFILAAAVLVGILPVVADGPATQPPMAPSSASAAEVPISPAHPGSRRVLLTGTLVCLRCENRHEAGLCPLPESQHEPAFCADNGEVWRLMTRDPSSLQAELGQTITLEGVGFPRSGFLRASRVGY
jgi:hypothetical protein